LSFQERQDGRIKKNELKSDGEVRRSKLSNFTQLSSEITNCGTPIRHSVLYLAITGQRTLSFLNKHQNLLAGRFSVMTERLFFYGSGTSPPSPRLDGADPDDLNAPAGSFSRPLSAPGQARCPRHSAAPFEDHVLTTSSGPWQTKSWFIEDNGSINGTFVNGVQLWTAAIPE
jgi:hypothetical protein